MPHRPASLRTALLRQHVAAGCPLADVIQPPAIDERLQIPVRNGWYHGENSLTVQASPGVASCFAEEHSCNW